MTDEPTSAEPTSTWNAATVAAIRSRRRDREPWSAPE